MGSGAGGGPGCPRKGLVLPYNLQGSDCDFDAPSGKRSNGLGLVDSKHMPDKQADLVKDSWRGQVTSPESYCARGLMNSLLIAG